MFSFSTRAACHVGQNGTAAARGPSFLRAEVPSEAGRAPQSWGPLSQGQIRRGKKDGVSVLLTTVVYSFS